MRPQFTLAILFSLFSIATIAQHVTADSAYIVNNYVKWERMIPMRDGVKLFTSIYLPRDSSVKHPILITRTPYSCEPYGEGQFRKIWERTNGLYAMYNYIIVFQDVRGRYMSEGEFVDVRPFNPNKQGTQTDEASDSYDTIEWLLQNLPGNNGNVGVFGTSYPGFYSTMAALSGHQALKAVSPQAPVTDWFIGDDFHHNGAFMLFDAFEFYNGFGVPRPRPLTTYNKGYERTEKDAYKFYLQTGALPNFNNKYFADSIAFWNDLMSHPDYDDWWRARNPRNYVSNLKPAMLTVGGLFDAEDCFGAWNLYKAIEAQNTPSFNNKIVMGPWYHGGWTGRSDGKSLGAVRFGAATSLWYQQQVELPFFEHYLNNKKPAGNIAEATVFFSGQNEWKQLAAWPPKKVQSKPMYLQAYGKLSFSKPRQVPASAKPNPAQSYTTYVSDPDKPVPHEGTDTIKERTREYMVADQRFADKRNDVITFRTNVLDKPLTLAGPVIADLMVSLSGTDADFIVKVIDEFPKNISTTAKGADTVYAGVNDMNGYQMLVRGETMRGKYRNSFEQPEPFVPNKITRVRFELPDVAHTFLPGHRLMIQIQSTWFPLTDRNPQQFMNIYQARDEDFQKATIRVFHTDGVNSKIWLPVWDGKE